MVMDRRRHPRLSLDLLRGFRAAARYLSFTRAAQELFLTQPAISREIKTLEDQLGQRLFRRVNRALQLTPAGEELYRAADEAITLIDNAAMRLAGSDRTLAVTTTVPLASLWLGPRLSQFTRRNPGIDVRIQASNDRVNLDREQVDVAIRWVPPDEAIAGAELLVDYKTFPVCSRKLERDLARTLRTPTDPARQVLIDFESVVYGRRWSDWDHWLDAMGIRGITPTGSLRFSHYDQVIQAAIEDGGIAIGKWPHLTRHLRDGVLRAPLGANWVASLGSFFLIVAPGAIERESVAAFVAWLKDEVRRDAERMPALLRGTSAAPSQRTVKRAASRRDS